MPGRAAAAGPDAGPLMAEVAGRDLAGSGWAAAGPGAPRRAGMLPAWPRALVVAAHPDDETFGLGAVLDRMAASGADVHVLCYTRGEASTLNENGTDLRRVREQELRKASRELGIPTVMLLDYPDGRLGPSRRASWPDTPLGWRPEFMPMACWSSMTPGSPATLTTRRRRVPRCGPPVPPGCRCWPGRCPLPSPADCARRPASHSRASRRK